METLATKTFTDNERAIVNTCRHKEFFGGGISSEADLRDNGIQGNISESMVREANYRTSSELPSSLGGVNSGAIEGSEIVTHQGVLGRFKEIQRRVACRLDEAFEPTPMERLRKAGHTVWAFEPEDGCASRGGRARQPGPGCGARWLIKLGHSEVARQSCPRPPPYGPVIAPCVTQRDCAVSASMHPTT
ncbi:hypothetical protein [Methylobacterium aerolatum]|uniref:Uncharacterized protein n=1 Tax=Methylobacterium aerolatum TaxID=418708 RepID=A0ABU0I2K6_9HYPH|nr:hypothetical protein [Methylobacterium aerolatum]MDQ0448824.1 hypothetical protein [Methylobacterium aerolatum]